MLWGGDVKRSLVIVVHGTFAADSNWIEDGSEFRRYLEDQIDGEVQTEALIWSGKNQHSARLEAADQLAARIQQVKAQDPEITIYLFGHSHGGNAITYAMRDPKINAAVEGVVSICTPFIRTRKREVLGFVALMFFVCAMFVSSVLFGQMRNLPMFDGAMFGVDPDAVGRVVYSLELGFNSASIHRISTFLSYWPSLIFATAIYFLAIRPVRPKVFQRQSETFERLFQTRLHSDQLLRVSVSGDEAAGWLKFSARMAGIGQTLSRIFIRSIRLSVTAPFFVGLAIVAVYYNAPDYYRGHFQGPPAGILTTLFYLGFFALMVSIVLWALAQVFSVVAAIIFRSNRFGYGRERPLDTLLLSTIARAAPETIEDRITSLRVEDPDVSMGLANNHNFLYEDIGFLKDVTEWINSGRKADACNDRIQVVSAYEKSVGSIGPSIFGSLLIILVLAVILQTGTIQNIQDCVSADDTYRSTGECAGVFVDFFEELGDAVVDTPKNLVP